MTERTRVEDEQVGRTRTEVPGGSWVTIPKHPQRFKQLGRVTSLFIYLDQSLLNRIRRP